MKQDLDSKTKTEILSRADKLSTVRKAADKKTYSSRLNN